MRLTNNGIPLFVCLSISSFVCLFVFFFFLGTAPVSCHPYTLPIHFWNIGCRGFFFFTRRRKKTNTRTHTQKKNKFRSDPRFCQDVHNSQVLFCLVWSSFFFCIFCIFLRILGQRVCRPYTAVSSFSYRRIFVSFGSPPVHHASLGSPLLDLSFSLFFFYFF